MEGLLKQTDALVGELKEKLDQRVRRSIELKKQLADARLGEGPAAAAVAPIGNDPRLAAAGTAPSGGGTPRPCQRQALFHGKSHAEMNRTYLEPASTAGWVLVDSFVMRTGNPCPWNAPCLARLPVVAIELMARIYKGPPWNMPQRTARPFRRRQYDALASNASVTWTCTFATGEATEALPNTIDGDRHTLIVRCPLPQGVLDGGTDGSGRLTVGVRLVAADKDHRPLLSYREIHACANELVPADTHLGTCVMFQEMAPLDTAATVAMWTRFMLDSGFTFVALYIDPMDEEHPEVLEQAVHAALAPEIAAGSATTILFHMNGRYSLQTQSAQQNHCQWRFRGRAKWIAQLDLDEFIQPLGPHQTVAGVLAKYDSDAMVAALQVRNRFWDHDLAENHSLTAYDAWNLVWRDDRPSVSGREKIVSKSELVDYISVHKVTTGGKSKVPDPEAELRHNHYSRHFKGHDAGADCGSSFRGGNCVGAMKNPRKDLSFSDYYLRISQDRDIVTGAT